MRPNNESKVQRIKVFLAHDLSSFSLALFHQRSKEQHTVLKVDHIVLRLPSILLILFNFSHSEQTLLQDYCWKLQCLVNTAGTFPSLKTSELLLMCPNRHLVLNPANNTSRLPWCHGNPCPR